MPKILIEFYCKENAENIIPFLYESYDRVYFVYFDGEKPDGRSREVLDKLVSEKFGAEPGYVRIEQKDLASAYTALQRIIYGENEYHIDLTGGSELFKAASGVFIGNGKPGKIKLFTFDLKNGVRREQYPNQRTDRPVRGLSIQEHIMLSGGEVISVSQKGFAVWDKQLRSEIIRMWDAVKTMPNEWNRFCSLSNFKSDTHYKRGLPKAEDRIVSERVIKVLHRRGIIKNEKITQNDIGKYYLHYDLSEVSKTVELYEKSGTALELYSCLAASECGSFTDTASGVCIDLDGNITNKKGDPRNEIDLCAVYKERLVLASCKNTIPVKEHLYEILTMADQYGGPHAVPMLICSEPALEPLKERAKEMGVRLIDNVINMSLSALKNAMSLMFP